MGYALADPKKDVDSQKVRPVSHSWCRVTSDACKIWPDTHVLNRFPTKSVEKRVINEAAK